MPFLTNAEYPAVRAAIDISLDPTNLPDDVIALPVYAGEAEQWVLAMNPLAGTYTTGSAEYLRMQVAAIYACAALVAPSVPVITGETFGQDHRYTRKDVDMAALAEKLWERARSAINAVIGVTEADSRPPRRFIFTRASGRRGAFPEVV